MFHRLWTRLFVAAFLAMLLMVPIGLLSTKESRAAGSVPPPRYQLYMAMPGPLTPLGTGEQLKGMWDNKAEALAAWNAYRSQAPATAFLLDTGDPATHQPPRLLETRKNPVSSVDTFIVESGNRFNQLVLHHGGETIYAAYLPKTPPSGSFVPQPGVTYLAFDRVVNGVDHPQTLFVPTDTSKTGGVYENPLASLDLRTAAPAQVTGDKINAWLAESVHHPGLSDLGSAYIDAQKHYGTNALYLIAASILESGGGTSSYARDRNNLFGVGASDTNPEMAAAFPSKPFAVAWQSYWIRTDWLEATGINYGGEPTLFGIENRQQEHAAYASDPYYVWKVAFLMQQIYDGVEIDPLNPPSGSKLGSSAQSPTYALSVSGHATTEGVKLREQPTTSSGAIASLKDGEQAQIDRLTVSPTPIVPVSGALGYTFPIWYHVTTSSGQTGWASGVYFTADSVWVMRLVAPGKSPQTTVPLYAASTGTQSRASLSQGTWVVRSDKLGAHVKNGRVQVTAEDQQGWINAANLQPLEWIKGDDRYETSVRLLDNPMHGWEHDVYTNVILVNGAPGHEVDALAANSLAGALHAPVLVVDGLGTLSLADRAFIQSLRAKQAFIVGGVMGDAVKQALKNDLHLLITPLSGLNRYETALAVADYITNHTDAKPKQIFLATGTALPDALSVGPLAVGEGSIVLLVNPNGDNSAVMEKPNALKRVYGASVYALGGTTVVPDNVVKATGATRISGNDRYLTNLAFLKKFQSSFNLDTLYLTNGATGHEVDALSAGAVAGQKIHPLLLTNGTSLSSAQVSWLAGQRGKIHSLVFVGGVLSAQLQIAIQDALAAH